MSLSRVITAGIIRRIRRAIVPVCTVEGCEYARTYCPHGYCAGCCLWRCGGVGLRWN